MPCTAPALLHIAETVALLSLRGIGPLARDRLALCRFERAALTWPYPTCCQGRRVESKLNVDGHPTSPVWLLVAEPAALCAHGGCCDDLHPSVVQTQLGTGQRRVEMWDRA
jgi:hypothetical protein